MTFAWHIERISLVRFQNQIFYKHAGGSQICLCSNGKYHPTCLRQAQELPRSQICTYRFFPPRLTEQKTGSSHLQQHLEHRCFQF